MRTLTILCVALAHTVILPQQSAQAACGSLPPQVRNLDTLRTVRLILNASRTTYVINDNCFDLNRQDFRGILSFQIINQFPEDLKGEVGALFVKSYRLFSNEQTIKIKVSRGDGWLYPNASGELADAARLNDRPVRLPIDDWDKAHSTFGTPEEFSKRLPIAWHAYADKGQGLPSTTDAAFWEVKNGFDKTHGAVTNILIKFEVNTDPDKESLIPFHVYVQPEVRSVELAISSNIKALAGKYRFLLR